MTVRSLWLDTAPPAPARPPLEGDAAVDVCVVGAGCTGLWTAYHLLVRDPSLSVLVVEAEHVGFGASGRNGGWCSTLLPQGVDRMTRDHGPVAAQAMRAAARGTLDEVERVVRSEGIDCHWQRGGTVVVARDRPQLQRAAQEVAADERAGSPEGLRLLDAEQTREVVGMTRALGATFTPDCARVHPLRLVQGLAAAVERRGGRIVEGTRALELTAGRVRTGSGTVRARHVLRATEAWTARFGGREVVPVYSLVVATEPLPAQAWDRIGLAGSQTFSDHRHTVVYGQRTADDRLVFGGRGAPYHYGSAIRPEFDGDERVFAVLRATVRDMFPVLAGVRFTHAWGGPLGIARDWHACVRHDASTGLGSAGGYVGDGVATSNLAGRTLADAVTGTDSDLVRLPWFGHVPPRWEPEPLRWAGVNAGLLLARAADTAEAVLHHRTPLTRVLARLTAH
ncbi:NAD(P)/FAD-dependent oxidoreductase [Kineococcus sp. SYSU DK003]|uniref:NAD(P)/FAD-dependent oxidoreductase n=1 Tax=Kineococcus sp. SYSU DK003 TaxID=3383124 RepID=UPI003D7CCB4B